MFGVKGNLTPAQRALLKLIETLIAGAFIAGAQAALPLLSNPDVSKIAWGSVLHTFFIAAVLAVSLGVSKYHTAQADPPLPLPAPAPAVATPVADPAAVPVAAVALSADAAASAPALPLESNV